MKLSKILAPIGRILHTLILVVGIVATLVVLTGTHAVSAAPGLTSILDALNNIADAIRTVSIVGPEGPEGPPGPLAEIYVRSEPAPEVVGGFGGSTVFCDEGDVATGGGVSCPVSGACGSGSNGPFVSYAGPVLNDLGQPIGWEFAMDFVAVSATPLARELYVVCADVSDL